MIQETLDKYKNYLISRSLSLNYFLIIRTLSTFLNAKNIEFAQITQDTLTELFIEKKYSINSKNMILKAGRSYGDYLGIKKEDNIFYKTKLMKTARRVVTEYFTEADLEEAKKQIVNFYAGKMTPLKIRVILDFLFYTGVRKMEMLTLKRKDIDLENNWAKITGKGNKERIICYPKKVSDELKVFFKSCAEEENAFNSNVGTLHYMMVLINKYTGKKVHTHSFRHGYAKNCMNKGIAITVVSKLLGHSSISTTMLYADPSTEEMKAEYQRTMNLEDKPDLTGGNRIKELF